MNDSLDFPSTIFVSTTFAADGTPVGKVLDRGSKVGIFHWELGSNHCFEKDPVALLNKFPGTYLVHNYFPVPQESLVVNIASLDPVIWEQSKRHVLNSIDFCRKIGAKLYTVHPGFLQDPQGTNNKTDYDFAFDKSKMVSDKITKAELHQKATGQMISALREILPYAKQNNVTIALETEGSIDKKDFLLLQQPEEYTILFQEFPKINLNLNVAHLGLAATAFGFSISSFINVVAPQVIAMELSHNQGIKDDHLPLQPEGWYWPVIGDARFLEAYKIIEARNTPVEVIRKTVELLREKIVKK